MNAPALNTKALSTVQAEAALAGATLLQIETDDGKPLLVLTREEFTAQFNSVEQVRRVLAELVAIGEVAHV